MAHPDHTKDKSILHYSEQVFVAIFHDEILKRLSMVKKDDENKPKNLPSPIDFRSIKKAIDAVKLPVSDHAVPTLEENIAAWFDTVKQIWKTKATDIKGKAIEFDKDDALLVEFVTASSNIRSVSYNIPPQTLFKVKEMAGNIIPAIATTNAIVAGLQVLEAVRIIKGCDIKTQCKNTYVLRFTTRRKHLLDPESLSDPKPDCFVCQTSQMHLRVDTTSFKLRDLLDLVIKKSIGFNEPSISVDSSGVWEEGEGADDFSRNLDKTLEQLSITDSSILTVEDFTQDLETEIIVTHCNKESFDKKLFPDYFEFTGTKPTVAAAPSSPLKGSSPTKATSPSKTRAAASSSPTTRKRQREEGPLETAPTSSKKAKITVEIRDDDVIEIE
jgi:ubiquitin-like 1-activating enzyme E1 B